MDDGTYTYSTVTGYTKVNSTPDGKVDYYTPNIISANDYYPFGSLMPGRKYSPTNTKYRYGFNGKENDNDVKGIEGGQQDYGMRIYDPRLGRFLSVDPITAEYPWLTPYQFASNTPVAAIDIDGLEAGVITWYPGMTGSANPWNGKAEQSAGLDIIPGVGTVKGLGEAITGKDLITGEKLAWWQRGLNLLPLYKPAKKLIKGFNAVEEVSDVSKVADNVNDANKSINTVTTVTEVATKAADKTATVSKVYKSAKLNAIASQYGDDIAKVAAQAGKEGPNVLRTSLIGAKQGLGVAWQAHHILPAELLGKSKILREAVKQGFDFNGLANGIALDLTRHSGSHKKYTDMVLATLETNFNNLRGKRNYKEIAEITAQQLRDRISNTTGKINEIK